MLVYIQNNWSWVGLVLVLSWESFNENVCKCFCTNVSGLNGKHEMLRKRLSLSQKND